MLSSRTVTTADTVLKDGVTHWTSLIDINTAGVFLKGILLELFTAEKTQTSEETSINPVPKTDKRVPPSSPPAEGDSFVTVMSARKEKESFVELPDSNPSLLTLT